MDTKQSALRLVAGTDVIKPDYEKMYQAAQLRMIEALAAIAMNEEGATEETVDFFVNTAMKYLDDITEMSFMLDE